MIALAFGGGFILGLLLGLVCLDRYYKIYLSQIVDWIMKDLSEGKGDAAKTGK